MVASLFASPQHHVTMSVSHFLAPCHQTSQSFALLPATKPVSHLTCPLPLHHRVSQSFALPPATKPVSHLPCPLPPNQSVIWLALYHCVTTSPCQSLICLAPCHQTSQSFALPSTTTSLHHHATKPVSHLPCPLPPNQSFALPPATKPVSHLTCPLPLSLHHHVSQSFVLPPATKTSHLTCPLLPHHHVSQSFALPLPPNQSVICLAPCHQTSHLTCPLPPCHHISQSFALPPATKSVSHLTCPLPLLHRVSQSFALPLPPNQSVICLAPCHQTSQSFDLPSTTASPHHHVTASVSHLPCPLPPN